MSMAGFAFPTRRRRFALPLALPLGLAVLAPAAGALGAATFVSHEEAKVLPPSGLAGDVIGRSVADEGITLAIGSPGEDNVNGDDAGAVYVFQRYACGSWFHVKGLFGSDSAGDDRFGRSVAISGDTIAVGAPLDDGAGENAGAVYLFERDAGGEDNWGEVKKIVPPDAEAGDEFGNDLALDLDTLVAGSRFDDDLGAAAGSAYVFGRDEGGAGNWGEVKKLLASDGAAGGFFGRAVGVGGDVVVVGAPLAGAGGGAAYVFERAAGGADEWGEVAKLLASDGAASDEFGDDVGASGDVVVVGARGDDGNSGAAYVFERAEGGGGVWAEVKKLVPGDAAPGDTFGWAVSVRGDALAIGARLKDGGSGAAYLFARDEGGAQNWGEVAKLLSTDIAGGDELGVSVGLGGDFVAVGARGDDAACPADPDCNSGSAYVFARVVFGDNFDDGVLPADWDFRRGTWEESGGSMNGVPDSDIGAQNKARAIADPAFEGCDLCGHLATLRLSDVNPDALPAEVHVRLLAWFAANDTNLAVSLKTEQDKVVVRQKEDAVALERLSCEMPLEPDTSYSVRAEFDGVNFRVLVDDELCVETESRFSSTPFGTIGVQSRDAEAHLDDLLGFPTQDPR